MGFDDEEKREALEVSSWLLDELQAGAQGVLKGNLVPLEGRLYLAAGTSRVRQVRTRDLCFASAGAILAGEKDAVKDTLEAVLDRRRPDGAFPAILDSSSPLWRQRFSGWGWSPALRAPLKPFYPDAGAPSFDLIPLLAHACAVFVERTNDLAFAKSCLTPLVSSMETLDVHWRNDLLVQGAGGDWLGPIAVRRGRLTYTNVVYWRGLTALAYLADRAGKNSSPWKVRAGKIRAKVQEDLWDPGRRHYIEGEGSSRLALDGNLLAVFFGMTERYQASEILQALDSAGVWTDLGPKAATPPYPEEAATSFARRRKVSPLADRWVWGWQAALGAVLLFRGGYLERALKTLAGLGRPIFRDKGVAEAYDPSTASRVRGSFFRAEERSTWAAGLLLEVLKEIRTAY